LSKLKVPELKELLKEAGLPVSGKKADLIARLEEHRAEDGAAEEEAEEEPEEEAEEEEEEEEAEPVAEKAEKAEPAAKKAAKDDAAFAAGDTVEALYEEEKKNYPAIVQRDYGDGTFMITWTEDNYEYTCKAENMKLKKKSPVSVEYQAGDPVEGYFEEEEKWYTARVKMNNGDGTIKLTWDEDGEEYDAEPKHIKLPVPKIPLSELEPGQKFKGTVGRCFKFGTFVDIGAERDGLVSPYYQYEGDEYKPKEGDYVEALCDDDDQLYMATVKEAAKDGKTFTVTWDEDGEDYEGVKKEDMSLAGVASLEEGSQVDVWVSEVRTMQDGQQRLGLTMAEDKVGVRPPRRPIDLSSFESVSRDEWLTGTVARCMPFGLFVKLTPPGGGREAQGLVHITEIRDGFVENTEDEAEEGQEVQVCVKNVDSASGRLSLSMKGC